MTKPLHRILVIFGLFLIINFTANAKSELSFKQNLVIEADGINHLFSDVGSGSLYIHGADVDEISVEATIRSKKYSNIEELEEAFNEKMVLILEDNGSKATLKSMTKNKIFNNNINISIDLNVTVPFELDLQVDDGSGSMKITDMKGNLDIDDGSGSLVIKNIVGDILIDDGSGSQTLSNIDGSVIVDDGSGSVNMKNVSGDVTIDDGSGSINIEGLSGQFKLIDDGSGSIYVNGKKWINKD